MNIDVSEYRMHIGLHYHHHLKIKGLSLLLLNSGDVETNPGPASEYSTPSVSSTSSLKNTALREKFSLVHYNVQSLAYKKRYIVL